MVNQDIITALQNAVSKGERLESAMQVMINSGYNPREVQDAANFVGGSNINFQPKPQEQLTTPSQKKSMFGFKKPPQPLANQQNFQRQSTAIKQAIAPPATMPFQQNSQSNQYPTNQNQQPLQPINQFQQTAQQTPLNQHLINQFQTPQGEYQSHQTSSQVQEYKTPEEVLGITQPSYNESDYDELSQPISNKRLRSNNFSSSGSLSRELQGIKPKKSYAKEIVLLAILLVLIATLIVTIVFRNTILGWFA